MSTLTDKRVRKERDDDPDNFFKYSILYNTFMKRLAQTGDVRNVEKALNIGVEKNFLKPKTFYPLVTVHIARNEIDEAVNIFCEKCKEYESTSGFSQLSRALIKEQNVEGLQKIMDAVIEIKENNFALMMLIFELAKLGQVKQMKKLIETKGFFPPRNGFEVLCKRLYKLNSKTGFESLLATTKDFRNWDRSLLYYNLLNLYKRENDVEKANALWQQLQEENFPVESWVLESFTNYIKKTNSGNSDFSQTELENEGFSGNIRVVLKSLARKGNVEKLVELIKENNATYAIKACSRILMSSGHYNSYIKFVRLLMDIDPIIGAKGFYITNMYNCFSSNDSLFLEYKQLAIDFFTKHNIHNPLYRTYMTALHYNKFVKEAEDIFFNYFVKSHMDLTTCIPYFKSQVENLLSSERLRTCESLRPHLLYSTVIKQNINVGDFSKAVSYLEQAVSENLGHTLDPEVLLELDEVLQKEGKKFPYPNLLVKDQENTLSEGETENVYGEAKNK